MSHRILVNPGTAQAWEIPLRPGVSSIGSSEESAFIINHPSISPRHCEVLVSDAGVLLRDLGSKSGTFVNGSPIRETWLQPGQHIQIGAINTVFESTPTSAPPVNQPAPGATIFVAAIGSPPTTQPDYPPALSAEQSKTDFETTEKSAIQSASEPAGPPKKFPVHLAAERETVRRKQFILGASGAIAGGFVGVLAWLVLIKTTGSALLLMAWGVGGLTGLGAALLAKNGGLPLGVFSVICALAAIVVGDGYAVKAIREQATINQSLAAYRAQLEFAKEALRANKPEEFRKLIAQANAKNPDEVTDDQIQKFQEEELPTLRNFALGKPSKVEFAAELQPRLAEEFDYKVHFLKDDVKSGLFLVLFGALGLATAYKVSAGKSNVD